MKVKIIAEAGVNHNGDIRLAKDMIDTAAECGADYIKFQTFKADSLVIRSANKAGYQIKNTPKNESQYEMLRSLELSKEMHIELIEHSKKRKINFLSTGFDVSDIKLLLHLGISIIKIPSGEITNLPYLRYVGSLGLPIILSTGMSDMNEVSSALKILEDSGARRNTVTILHCHSEYPTSYCDVNLNAMLSIRDQLKVSVGYSDHTLGIEIAIAAVALGAVVIEKHFTMDRSLPGPDHQCSLMPKEFDDMVRAIRNVEVALGSGKKIPTEVEIQNKIVARKSLVASRAIKNGEKFTEFNICAKRPGSGVSPMQWDSYMGIESTREYDPDDLLEPL